MYIDTSSFYYTLLCYAHITKSFACVDSLNSSALHLVHHTPLEATERRKEGRKRKINMDH